MLALSLRAPAPAAAAPLQVVELADPEPASDELVLEVAACAVCRTDLQLARSGLTTEQLIYRGRAEGWLVVPGLESGWRHRDTGMDRPDARV